MGFPMSHCVCSSCKRVAPGLIFSPQRMYQFDDGTKIPLNGCDGWCYECDQIRRVEDLSLTNPLASLRRVSASLRSASARRQFFSTRIDCVSFHELDEGNSTVRERNANDFNKMGALVDVAWRQIDYLSGRSVSPRCLDCGSHNIEKLILVVDGKKRGWKHPGCDGVFYMSVTGHWHLAPSKVRLIYRPDGMFSHEEEK